MKRILKIWLITMAALGILGVLLLVSGRLLGGTYWEALRISSFGSFWNYGTSAMMQVQVIQPGTAQLAEGDQYIPHHPDSIRGLDLEISGTSELVIQKGEGYSLLVEEQGRPVKSEVEDGVWHIESHHHDPYGRLVLTLPTEKTMEEIELQLNGGILTSDGLDAVKVELDMNGVVVDLKNVNCGKLEVDMAAGEVNIQGNVTHKADINIVAGTFLLTMPRPEDYTYNIPTGIGTVSLDGQSFEGFGGGMQSHGGSGPHFEIECIAGTADVVFEDQ